MSLRFSKGQIEKLITNKFLFLKYNHNASSYEYINKLTNLKATKRWKLDITKNESSETPIRTCLIMAIL